MTGESQSRLVGRLEAISAAAAAGVFAVGCLVLLGWVFDIAALKSIDPSLVSTKADTATAFVLTGIALWLSQAGRRGFRAGRYVVWSSAAIVAAIGLLTLLEYASGRSFGIDQLFFTEPAGAVRTIHPGRMAPNTAVNFLFIGLALLLLDVRTRRGHRPAQFLIGLGGMVAAVALVGYLYDVSSFYSPSSATTPMSVLAALAGMIAFLGLALARPAPALVALLTGENAGSVMARRLLLPVLLAPVLLDLLLLAGQWTGLYGEHVASAVHTILLTVGLFGLVWMTAVSLNRSDSRRRQDGGGPGPPGLVSPTEPQSGAGRGPGGAGAFRQPRGRAGCSPNWSRPVRGIPFWPAGNRRRGRCATTACPAASARSWWARGATSRRCTTWRRRRASAFSAWT